MTRMTRNLSASLPFLALLALVVTGCGPSKEQLKIEDLTSENDQLKNELNDRDRQLNDAIARENEARSTIDELNRELASLRADAKKSKKSGDWVITDSFAMISVPGELLFPSGKAVLTRSGRRKLATIASDIRARYPDRDIYVFGYTDNEPIRKSKWKDNWELGAARALTVVRAMSEYGIPPSNLVQASCSKYRPKANNSTPQGRAKNRRVEFYAIKRAGGPLDNTSARANGND
ncbi:MAG: OmpA family protein [Phycisphaerae bacterium]